MLNDIGDRNYDSDEYILDSQEYIDENDDDYIIKSNKK
jgi:hypothetical protein